jgi:hypothetical protein
LFTPGEDTIGLTPTKMTMCAHAALSFGKAFNATPEDFNVFWTALNAEQNGINGRKVEVTYENDNYQAQQAVTAATACNAKKPFILLGGIGFDQIPAVRNYAEQAHVLYLHHTATIQGTQGQKYSFTELPTVERTGEAFAQLAASKYKGKKIGIIERDSANWSPGAEAFQAVRAADRREQEGGDQPGQLHRRDPGDEERRGRGGVRLGERAGRHPAHHPGQGPGLQPQLAAVPVQPHQPDPG